ncbi:MAG: Glutathione-regulated potassium-efflux system protein KefB [Candidatus Roizmanbacteria bacterium GW2011_GWA2_35_8]|uniref:Glutathione-regulated potassium-efflux system protein KefB n=1 Tax=Candidatus Roizmanbacteria bacterium GW2011_GWA2_35_8 TaxID=1618479 RepID=A0A0G0D0K8_9BACT|nr:MAG: Glutathione-regulated potassium-efflux system protein KefB [Candidatus Roizmanbacteria bacterium GW2011_GWA2_35_8]
MGEISLSLALNFFLYLAIPFALAIVAKKAKISPLIGYIVGGLVIGNLFPELSTSDSIRSFAYFGIIFLLFTLGLETNFGRILVLKKFIVIGGLLQLFFSTLFVFFFSVLFKFSILESFLIGIALSSSSTTIVAKIIQDRGEESSFIGEIAMGILIFQDIAFIPYLLIFTSITGRDMPVWVIVKDTIIGLIEAGLIITSLYYLGRKIIPKVFNKVARISRELFDLFIVVFIFFVVGLSIVLKIPTLIGVMVAGVLLAQTIEHYHIFSEIRPLRNLLGVIFFVYIGSHIQLANVITHVPQILLFTVGVIFIKAVVILIIFIFLKFHSRASFNLSMYLFQIDEDAFILMSSAYLSKVISIDKYLFVITAVLITFILTPIFIANKDKSYRTIRSFIKKYLPFLESFITYRIDSNQSPIDELDIKNHVVICGYGRIGSYIGRSLIMADIPYIAIDYNFFTVEKAKKQGVNIIYGDPSDIDILDYAQVEDAIILIMAVPERYIQETIVLNAKKLNRDLYIISRVHKEKDQIRMKDLGVDLVVQPEFEASLSIIKRIYRLHKIDTIDIVNKIKRLKIEHGIS